MWAQTRLIPGVSLVQFRPTALFSFTSFMDLFYVDWGLIVSLCLVFPYCFLIFLFGGLFYIIVWRRTPIGVRVGRISIRFVCSFSVLWVSLFFSIILSWHSPYVLIFQEHLLFNNVGFFLLLIIFFVSCISPLIFSLSGFVFCNELIVLTTLIIYFLFCLAGLLSLVTNLYTLVFVVEFLNLVVFLLLCFSRTLGLTQYRIRGLNLSPLLVFFWVNALTAVLFFSFLLFNANCGWLALFSNNTIDYCIVAPLNFIFFYFFLFFFIFIFIFKLGIPPFIFWKLQVFESTPFWFLVVYNIPYFLVILLVFFSIFSEFISLVRTVLTIDDGGILFFLTPVSLFLSATLLMLLVFLFRFTSVAYFLVVSSSLTSFILFFFLVIYFTFSNYLLTPPSPLYLYLFIYGILFFFLLVVFLLTSRFSSVTGRTALSGFFGTLVVGRTRLILCVFFFTAVLGLAGFPPLTLFFVKLRLISDFFVTPFFGFSWTALLILFLFLSIYFYYRTVRFVLPPVNRLFSDHFYPIHPNTNNRKPFTYKNISNFSVGQVCRFYLFAFFFSNVVAMFFILFTGLGFIFISDLFLFFTFC